MASTGVHLENAAMSAALKEKRGAGEAEKDVSGNASSETASIRTVPGDHTHRKLKSRHIQMIGTSRPNPTRPLTRD